MQIEEVSACLLHFQPVVFSLVASSHQLVLQNNTGYDVVSAIHLYLITVVGVWRKSVHAQGVGRWGDDVDLERACRSTPY